MLDELTTPGVLEHVMAIEARSRESFGALLDRFGVLGDVRSVGALTALEFVTDRATKERDLELQDAVAYEVFARGLITDSSTTSLNVQPSLITPLEVIDQAADIVSRGDLSCSRTDRSSATGAMRRPRSASGRKEVARELD